MIFTKLFFLNIYLSYYQIYKPQIVKIIYNILCYISVFYMLLWDSLLFTL